MKKILYLFILSTVGAYGQITINQGDMPQSNDVFIYSEGTTNNGEPELTGENYTWDYLDLSMITQGADTFVSIGDTPFLYQFFFNNGFLYPDHQADVALSDEDIDLFTVSATNLFNYYKNDTDGYRLVGFGATINGIPQSIQYEPIEWIYEFPMSFGNNFEGTSFVEFSLPGFGYISQEKEIQTEVDGWGNLMLPIGEFDVLRVKKTINAVDSIYNETLGFGLLVPQPQEIKYQWLADGEIEPILEISLVGGAITSTRYKDDFTSSIDEFSKEQVSLYPNPAREIIQVTISQAIDKAGINILDATGRRIPCDIDVIGNNYQINVSSLNSGYYILQIEQNGLFHTERFVVE